MFPSLSKFLCLENTVLSNEKLQIKDEEPPVEEMENK